MHPLARVSRITFGFYSSVVSGGPRITATTNVIASLTR
jgi:hypothetical protein